MTSAIKETAQSRQTCASGFESASASAQGAWTASCQGGAGAAASALEAQDACSQSAAAATAQASANSSDEKETKGRKTRHLWAAGGFLFFALGMVGVVLPILPTTPFILVAAFCFTRSSKKVNDWFKSTKVYKQVIEGYATKRMMTVKAKLSILIPVTVLLTIAFFLMMRVPVGQAVLVVVWVCHVIYFGFVVKTDRNPQPAQSPTES